MSLDFSLEVVQPTLVFDANYTHNVTPMWVRAGVYAALYESAGRLALDILPDLRRGLRDMEEHPEAYRPFDDPGDWGTYRTALPWLRKVVAACEENPDATIRVSK